MFPATPIPLKSHQAFTGQDIFFTSDVSQGV
jgi:hypothetical protein